MSAVGGFYVPDDATLRELGRLQVLHSQLDHTLRVAIKRMLGISINDPGYWSETQGMSATLRQRTRDLIAERYRDDDDTASILNKVLDDAEDVTRVRNRALHSVWMQVPGREPVLHDRDKDIKAHVNYPVPTVQELAEICTRVERVYSTLNHVTSKLR